MAAQDDSVATDDVDTADDAAVAVRVVVDDAGEDEVEPRRA
jgi:hypothetical protein